MITATISFNSDFHIGSGIGKAGYIDSLFVKDGQGNPTIPGQTLKGVTRDSCIRIANSLEVEHCISNKNKKHCCNCIICRIFGRASRPSKYLFSPAHLKTAVDDEKYPVRKRTGIDRETGTAKENALFSTEVAPCNLEFEFTIKPKPPYQLDELEVTLLKASILWTREIGGNRRRGLGHCTMTITEPAINKAVFKEELERLRDFNKDVEGTDV